MSAAGLREMREVLDLAAVREVHDAIRRHAAGRARELIAPVAARWSAAGAEVLIARDDAEADAIAARRPGRSAWAESYLGESHRVVVDTVDPPGTIKLAIESILPEDVAFAVATKLVLSGGSLLLGPDPRRSLILVAGDATRPDARWPERSLVRRLWSFLTFYREPLPRPTLKLLLDNLKPVKPTPMPLISEPIVRRVHTDLGLPELFAAVATAGGLDARLVKVDTLADAVSDELRRRGVETISTDDSALLRKSGLTESLASAFAIDAEAGVRIGDVLAGVAEPGTIVPPLGVAVANLFVLEPKRLVPDSLDFARMLSRPEFAGDLTLLHPPGRHATTPPRGDVVAFVLH
jgi:hypothetical protein